MGALLLDFNLVGMLVTPHNFGCISGDALCSTSASHSTKAFADGARPYTACVGWFPEKGPRGGGKCG